MEAEGRDAATISEHGGRCTWTVDSWPSTTWAFEQGGDLTGGSPQQVLIEKPTSIGSPGSPPAAIQDRHDRKFASQRNAKMFLPCSLQLSASLS